MIIEGLKLVKHLLILICNADQGIFLQLIDARYITNINPPSGGGLGAARGPQGVFFSTSGAIGTPKNSKKTDNIPRNEFLCRIFYIRVTEALSWRYLNKNAGQSWKSWVLLSFKKIVFGDFRVQRSKIFLQGLGIFPQVPYHICKMRVKVICVSDHLEESMIFWPGALF